MALWTASWLTQCSHCRYLICTRLIQCPFYDFNCRDVQHKGGLISEVETKKTTRQKLRLSKVHKYLNIPAKRGQQTVGSHPGPGTTGGCSHFGSLMALSVASLLHTASVPRMEGATVCLNKCSVACCKTHPQVLTPKANLSTSFISWIPLSSASTDVVVVSATNGAALLPFLVPALSPLLVRTLMRKGICLLPQLHCQWCSSSHFPKKKKKLFWHALPQASWNLEPMTKTPPARQPVGSFSNRLPFDWWFKLAKWFAFSAITIQDESSTK